MWGISARFGQPVDLTPLDLTKILFTCLNMFKKVPRFFKACDSRDIYSKKLAISQIVYFSIDLKF